MNTLNWGIIGTGRIANEFATALSHVTGANLVAVGSRTPEQAQEFAKNNGQIKAHSSYEALVHNPDVQAVYVATPHVYHCPHTLLALDAKKHVLCEKPFSVTALEAEQMVTRAQDRGLFLMEAMWTLFLPVMQRVREIIDAGEIGEVVELMATCGFRSDPNKPKNQRLFDPKLGGGALLDLGIYPVTLATLLFGMPVRIDAEAKRHENGIDLETRMRMRFSDGAVAVLHCSLIEETANDAVIVGTKGKIRLTNRWWNGQGMIISRAGQPDEECFPPYEGNGLHHQVRHFQECVFRGLKESPVMTHERTLMNMGVLAQIQSNNSI